MATVFREEQAGQCKRSVVYMGAGSQSTRQQQPGQ